MGAKRKRSFPRWQRQTMKARAMAAKSTHRVITHVGGATLFKVSR